MWATLPFVDIANAIVILVTGLLVASGVRNGRGQKSKVEPPAMEVVTDFFDAQAIGQLTKEVTGQAIAAMAQSAAIAAQTVAMREAAEAVEAHTLATDRHRHAVDDLTEQVKELRQAMAARR